MILSLKVARYSKTKVDEAGVLYLMKFNLTLVFILLALPTLLASQFQNPPIDSLSKELYEIVCKIAAENAIHSERIGYSGETTKQYRNFEQLISIAKIDDLLKLMNHPSPAVRGYAFLGLAEKKYTKLDEILMDHTDDNETVLIIRGCLIDELPVIRFMRETESRVQN